MFAILYPFILTTSVDIHSKYHWVTVLWFAEDSIATIPDHTSTRQIYHPEKQDLRCVKSPIKINMDRHYFSSVLCRFSVFRVAFCLIGVLTGMVFIYGVRKGSESLWSEIHIKLFEGSVHVLQKGSHGSCRGVHW